MKEGWVIQGQSSFTLDRAVELVVVEYDGPQIIVLRDSEGKRFVGVAADSDEDAVRWIHSSATELELTALASGKRALRSVLEKPEVWIVDENYDGKYINAWKVPSESIPEFGLPAPRKPLPLRARLRVAGILSKPVTVYEDAVALGGRAVDDSLVRMGSLGRYCGAFDNLCFVIGRDVLKLTSEQVQAAMPRTAPAFDGSFGLPIRPADQQGFSEIFRIFEGLIAIGKDPVRLKEAFARMGDHVATGFLEYLSVVEGYGFEVFCNWHKEGVFLEPFEAKGQRESIEPPATPKAGKAATGVFQCRGFFKGFHFASKQGHFWFVDFETGMAYRGKISSRLRSQFEHRQAVIVGIIATYDVIISGKSDKNGVVNHTLMSFERTD